MTLTFGERLKAFIEYKRMNIRSFEIETALKNGLVYRVIRNNTSLNGDSIAAIGQAWKDLDLNWLILGEGAMLRGNSEVKTNQIISKYSDSNKWDTEYLLDRADSQIKLQNDMITLLKEIIEDQKKVVNKVSANT